MEPEPINRNAIASADEDQLRRWLTNLDVAIRAPQPADMTDAQYRGTTYWILELARAIRTEIDTRAKTSDNRTGAGRTRAAI